MAVLDNAALRASDKGSLRTEFEEAVEASEALLATLPSDGCSAERALSQIALGNAYRARSVRSGEDELNERAIAVLEAGLAVIDPLKFPEQWAAGQMSLASAYRARSAGAPSQNLEKEIAAYTAALSVEPNSFPRVGRRRAYLGRALAFMLRSQGPKAGNLDHALSDLKCAAQSFGPGENPKEWADLHRIMAAVLLERAEGKHDKNRDEAIAALEVAAEAYYSRSISVDQNGVMAALEMLKKEAAGAASVN